MNAIRNLVVAILMTVVTTVLLGLVYPLAITALAQTFFPQQANGQLMERNGRTIGSPLIGQGFAGATYFHPRPSATSTHYDAANSAGSNLGPTNTRLIEDVRARVKTLNQENPGTPVPVDLVTTSASGFDPHITPAAAAFQVGRVARARGVGEAEVHRVVAARTEGRTLGLFGEPRVNVLLLNLDLDRALPPLAGGGQGSANR
ncbi:MAG: potassium-transporting ATPase subunit KdpC [Vicinamibacterales bacterium]